MGSKLIFTCSKVQSTAYCMKRELDLHCWRSATIQDMKYVYFSGWGRRFVRVLRDRGEDARIVAKDVISERNREREKLEQASRAL